MAESCPTCGQAVELHTGLEGTSSYVKTAEVERDSLRSLLVEAREALRQLEAGKQHWKNCHDGQVATKRRLSVRFGDLVRGVRDVAGDLRRLDDEDADELADTLMALTAQAEPEGAEPISSSSSLSSTESE